MKHRKRISLLLSCAVLIGTLAGCGAGAGSTETAQNTAAASGSAAGKSGGSAASETNSGNGMVLVVYYSATNHTKAVAETIAETLSADTFELVPIEPYTEEDLDWTNSDSRVSKEYDDPDSREVELDAAAVDNWDSYDTVFIGYPIWWGIAAWPVDTFVQANDFTGKTVIPFCTSSSSGLGQSGELLAELAGTGEWQAGERFPSSASDTDVSTWARSVMQ